MITNSHNGKEDHGLNQKNHKRKKKTEENGHNGMCDCVSTAAILVQLFLLSLKPFKEWAGGHEYSTGYVLQLTYV